MTRARTVGDVWLVVSFLKKRKNGERKWRKKGKERKKERKTERERKKGGKRERKNRRSYIEATSLIS